MERFSTSTADTVEWFSTGSTNTLVRLRFKNRAGQGEESKTCLAHSNTRFGS